MERSTVPEDRPSRILIRGPAGADKAAETASILRQYVAAHGSEDVVILDFSPGGSAGSARLDRRLDVPPRAWTAIVDTGSHRDPGLDEDAQRRIAEENARLGSAVIADMPAGPSAVFVNDVTVPFLTSTADIHGLLERLDAVDTVVLSAHTTADALSPELRATHRRLLDILDGWVDTNHRCE